MTRNFKRAFQACINSTIMPCIGSYQHPIGIRINMNSVKVIKFTNSNPKEFVLKYVDKFKETFNQESIIANITKSYGLNFL